MLLQINTGICLMTMARAFCHVHIMSCCLRLPTPCNDVACACRATQHCHLLPWLATHKLRNCFFCMGQMCKQKMRMYATSALWSTVQYPVGTSVAFNFGMRPSASFDALAFKFTQAWHPYFMMYDMYLCMSVYCIEITAMPRNVKCLP